MKLKYLAIIVLIESLSCNLGLNNTIIEGNYKVASGIEQNYVYFIEVKKIDENVFSISAYNKEGEKRWTENASKRMNESILTWNDKWLGCEMKFKDNKAELIFGNGTYGKIEFIEDRAIDNYTPPTTNLNFLKLYNGKYPEEVKLFENVVIKDRLIKLIGNKIYLDLVSNWNVESPINIENGIFKTDACKAHSCGSDEAYLVADINKNIIYLRVLRNGKSKIFSEDSKRISDDFFLNSL